MIAGRLDGRLAGRMELTNSMEHSPSWEAKCSKLLKKLPAFCGTRRFITVYTRACNLSLFWARTIQLRPPPHPTSRRSILILSFHLRLGEEWNSVFKWGRARRSRAEACQLAGSRKNEIFHFSSAWSDLLGSRACAKRYSRDPSCPLLLLEYSYILYNGHVSLSTGWNDKPETSVTFCNPSVCQATFPAPSGLLGYILGSGLHVP
jgi:hypothetical protein